MTDGERPSRELSNHPEALVSQGRKRYQKPTFRFEQVFETMALVCGKIDPTQSSCTKSRLGS